MPRPRQKRPRVRELVLPTGGHPRSDQRQVLKPPRSGDSPLVGRRDLKDQCVRFGDQCPAGEHKRRQHKHGHHGRKDQSGRASSQAPWQTGREPRVERPARDRGHARCQQSLEEAMQDPNAQDDDQRGIERSRGRLDMDRNFLTTFFLSGDISPARRTCQAQLS